MTDKEVKVQKYLLKNPLATPTQISKATKVSKSYALKIRNKIATPKEVIIKHINKQDRSDLLREAVSLTDGDRRKDYGDPVENHQHIADIFNAITGRDLSAREIVLVHEATKLARRQRSPKKKDHYVDNMAYVGIEYECVMAEED